MEYFSLPFDFNKKERLEFEDIHITLADNIDHESLPLPGQFRSFGFLHCIHGNGKTVFNDKVIIIKKGLFLLMHPGDIVTFFEVSQDTELIFIYITKSYMMKVDARLLDFSYIISNKIHQRILDQEQHQFLVQFERKFLREFHDQLKFRDLLLKVYVTELMIYTERLLQNISSSEIAHPLVAKFFDLVTENKGFRQNVSWYAEKLRISTKHLNEIIKAETGKTVKVIINDSTLLEAKNLLVNTDMSIHDISFKLNFSSNVYFSSFFKQQMSETPQQFRKREKMNIKQL